jgi:hypothetical protein
MNFPEDHDWEQSFEDEKAALVARAVPLSLRELALVALANTQVGGRAQQWLYEHTDADRNAIDHAVLEAHRLCGAAADGMTLPGARKPAVILQFPAITK